jgi:uncharacterized protein (TIGR03663 family)
VSVARPREASRPAGRSFGASLARLYARLEAALTLEVLLYALFVLVAAVTRFWDLGSRPLHHDESLHAYFSWQYYSGHGYQHDPMMHGPLLFHLTALMFLLFGDTEYTARIMPAVFGTVAVGLPYLLRRQLGRVSMLAVSFLLLISPGFWYYARFARNEAWAVVFTMLIVIGLVRWMDSRRPGWLHLAWVGWVLLFCSKEISFIVLFVFVTFGVLALGLAHSKATLAWLLALPVGLLLGMSIVPSVLGWRKLPSIPFKNPSLEKSLDYVREMAASPQVITSTAWALVWLVVVAVLLKRARIPEQLERIRQGEPANALSSAFAHLPNKWSQLALMLAAFLLISVPLYTSMFTNFRGGLMSGSFGQLFYWLAQQEVERGGQPWFYYAVLEPVYDPIAVLLGTAAILWGVFWLGRWCARRGRPLGVLQVAYAMMVWWAVLSLGIYSWAGEKMPWLSLHVALPLIFLAAVWGARALGFEEGWARSWAPRRPGLWAFVAAAAVIVGWTVYRMASWSLQLEPSGQSPLVWGLLALALLTLAAVAWLGARPAARSLTLLALGLLALYTLQSAVQLSYRNGAVPLEQMVYVQSSPRVTNTMEAISAVSARTAGPKAAPILYDDFVSWPFVWYLRDWRNARYVGDGLKSVPAGDVEFVLLGADKEKKAKPYLGNYTPFHYPMRWWFPEEMYRNLIPTADRDRLEEAGPLTAVAINMKDVARGIASWRKPGVQAKLWRYFMYRRPDGILNSSDMILYVRNDLVGLYNAERL